MSEKDYVLKTLKYLENAFKYLIGLLSAVVVFLVFNYDGSTISIMATGIVVVCVCGLVYVAYLLKRYLKKLRRL